MLNVDVNALIKEIGKKLVSRSLYLSTAESCTGGYLGHLTTKFSGASRYYLGGVVSYANIGKMNILDVRQETLDTFGAVSKQTAGEMAAGIQRVFASNEYPLEQIIGLSITGIAGPGGGTAEKPVGLVWISLESSRVQVSRQFQFKGTRLQIIKQSAQMALEMLLEII